MYQINGSRSIEIARPFNMSAVVGKLEIGWNMDGILSARTECEWCSIDGTRFDGNVFVSRLWCKWEWLCAFVRAIPVSSANYVHVKWKIARQSAVGDGRAWANRHRSIQLKRHNWAPPKCDYPHSYSRQDRSIRSFVLNCVYLRLFPAQRQERRPGGLSL